MSSIARRRLVERVSLVGLATFIAFSITAFGQAAITIAGLVA